MDSDLSPDEVARVNEMASKMTPPQVQETLERLALRELALLDDPRFGNDPGMREITLWNVATLCAAAESPLRPKKPA